MCKDCNNKKQPELKLITTNEDVYFYQETPFYVSLLAKLKVMNAPVLEPRKKTKFESFLDKVKK